MTGEKTMGVSSTTRTLAESALATALALALSYLKIPIGLEFGGFGGSVDLVMIPILVLALRRGAGWAVGAGLVFGTLKFFFAGGTAINWQSMLLDYSIAYAAVGLAGGLRNVNVPLAVFAGCLARFVIHFISGITIYAQWMPEVFLNLTMTNTWLYSALYNGTYMLPNTVLALVLTPIIIAALRRAKI